MEIVLKVKGLTENQLFDSENDKPITVEGKILAVNFIDGLYQKTTDQSAKYQEIQDNNKDKDFVMPNYCPYCGSRDMYDPNPKTDPLGLYCDDCGSSISKVVKSTANIYD